MSQNEGNESEMAELDPVLLEQVGGGRGSVIDPDG